jgi:hypothetical protein
MKLLATILCALLFTLAAAATTIRPMTIEEMAAGASHVVEGQAINVWSAWNTDHSEIMTYTRFNVMKSLKGNASGQIVVAQLGGTVEGRTVRVAGIRHFQVGETALLFLRRGDEPNTMSLDAMQGNFRVEKDATGQMVASNGLPGMSVLRGSQVVTFTGTPVPLTALESRIRKVVSQ